MMMRGIRVAFLLMIISGGAAAAQSSGQVYVQAFEDRDGSGTRDAGEPQLTGGIAVNLLNADGVIVASALLDESPNAARGLVGFQQMRPGDYTIEVLSAQYTATTPDTFTVTVSDSGVPEVLFFGAQPAFDAAAPLPAEETSALPFEIAGVDSGVVQIASAGVSSLVVICGMAVLGFVIYLLTLHRALSRAIKADARLTTTTGMRPVSTTSTGRYPVQKKTATGQFRPPNEADAPFRPPQQSTGQFRPPNTTDDEQ
jgi:hypothetical protein